ncbi:MAG: helix-turn-helix domain-containing protein [Candidatus Woesearchaeota archaeon]
MNEFEAIGLTKTEAKIYSVLVDLGKAQAGNISRKTGIHRRSVYDALERLIEKGLVSFIKENDKRYYIPSDPKRIREIIDEQNLKILNILPELEAKYNSIKQKQETLFYKGKEGIRTILEDQLKEGKTIYVMGGSRKAPEILRFYLHHYTEKRVKLGIRLKIIYSGVSESSRRVPFADVRFVAEEFATPVATNIYGDNVAIILWTAEPVAILIRNMEIARTYKKYFDVLWKRGRR